MTDEEADALDEEVTQNPPKVDPTKARRAIRSRGRLDRRISADQGRRLQPNPRSGIE